MDAGTRVMLFASLLLGGLAAAVIGAWAVMIRMPGVPGTELKVRPPAAEAQAAARLEGHVRSLAGEIGQRNIWEPGKLAAAARYIEGRLSDYGYVVDSQRFVVRGVEVRNLVATLPGTAPDPQVVLAGAHYDTVRDSPGADDNASGVAAMLELARRFAGRPRRNTLRLVAFVNEEAPFFLDESMGSQRYAAAAAARREPIRAMYSLEMLGYYDDRPGSQRYPWPFSLFYPDTADFIGIVGNLASRSLVRESIAAFRAEARIPSHGLAAPQAVPGVGWSDHAAFWARGYPAAMLTDTSFYRYPHYHTPADTPEKLDYRRMARVVDGFQAVLGEQLEAQP